MCRNITELRGLEPPATDDEVAAAARQYVRKVSGLRSPPKDADAARAYEAAVDEVARLTTSLLDALPARRRPPVAVPPSRRGHPAPAARPAVVSERAVDLVRPG